MDDLLTLLEGRFSFPERVLVRARTLFRNLGDETGTLTNFIPTLWAGGVLRTLDKNQVLTSPAIVNRDYEGQIRQMGDTVKILGVGDPTVSNYTRNTAIAAPEVLADSTRSLVIDQAKYVHFMMDDLDRAQANQNVLDRVTQRIGYKFRDAADVFIGSKYVDAGGATGSDATPIQFTAANAYGTLVTVATALSALNVEREGRYLVLPPWAIGILSQTPEFINARDSGETTIRNGFAGRAAGFQIFESNNLTTVVNGSSQTVYQTLAGIPDAITFAEQLAPSDTFEAKRHDDYFADVVRALYVYGAKVVLPLGLHNLKIRQ